MWLFTSPLSLFALVAVPTVLGIYFFRSRAKKIEVSSLFLWVDPFQAKQGGQRLDRLQIPLLLLLELIILTLLAVAAADPNIRRTQLSHPTIVILDNSYSMNARHAGGTTSVESAKKTLTTFLENEVGYPLHFILAGAKPVSLGTRITHFSEVAAVLAKWQPTEQTCDLAAALALAGNIGLEEAKYLVITDKKPPEDIVPGKIVWKSFGESADNLAFVHASRVFQGEKDRLLVEVANLSTKTNAMRLTVLTPQNNTVLLQQEENIAPGEVFRLRSTVPEGAGTLELRLAADALNEDNRLILLPPSRRPVRVRLDDIPPIIAVPLQKAIESSGLARITTERPEIIFTAMTPMSENSGTGTMAAGNGDFLPSKNRSDRSENDEWTVRFLTEPVSENIQGYMGPFVTERTHVLTDGLSLDGVVWGASADIVPSGFPLISAGNVVLLSEEIAASRNRRELWFQLNPHQSTLLQSPSWPILVWNLLRYRQEHSGGIPLNNVRLGSAATFFAAAGDEQVTVVPPSGATYQIPLRTDRIMIPASEVGMYTLRAASGEYPFAVGTQSQEESDLRETARGDFGSWLDTATLRADYESIVWILLLVSLAGLVLHWWGIFPIFTPGGLIRRSTLRRSKEPVSPSAVPDFPNVPLVQ